ncbi:MAG: hypothetical protein LBO73_04925 [Holosporaceae bacterium]|nr:hypothetical protein [Holosporaceae bacterium]
MKKYLLLIGLSIGLFSYDSCFGMRTEEAIALENSYRQCDRILDDLPETCRRQRSIRARIMGIAGDFLRFCENIESCIESYVDPLEFVERQRLQGAEQIIWEDYLTPRQSEDLGLFRKFMITQPLVWGYFDPFWERSESNFWLRKEISQTLSLIRKYNLPGFRPNPGRCLENMANRMNKPAFINAFINDTGNTNENNINVCILALSETCYFFDDIINLFQNLDFNLWGQLADHIRGHANVRLLFEIKDENFRGLAETLLLNIYGDTCPAKYFFDLFNVGEFPRLAETILKCRAPDVVRRFLESLDGEDEVTRCIGAINSDGKTPLGLFIEENYQEIFPEPDGNLYEVFNLLWNKCPKRLFLEYLSDSQPSLPFHFDMLSLYNDFAASFLINEKAQTSEQENGIKLFASEVAGFYSRYASDYIYSQYGRAASEKFQSDVLRRFLLLDLDENFSKPKCAGLLRNLVICLSDKTPTDEAGLVFMPIVRQFIRSINREHLRQILNLRSVNGTDLWDYVEKLLPAVRFLIQNEIPAGIRRQRTIRVQTAAQLTRSQSGRRSAQQRTVEAQSAATQREQQEQPVRTMPARVQPRTVEAQTAAAQSAATQPRTAEAQTAAQSAATQPGRQPAQPTAGAQGRRTARIMPSLWGR